MSDETEAEYEFQMFEVPVHEHDVEYATHDMVEVVDESSRLERANRKDKDGNPAPLPPRAPKRAIRTGTETHKRKRLTLPLPAELVAAGWEHQVAEPERMSIVTDRDTIPLQLRRKKPAPFVGDYRTSAT